jgi:hypothetical protein
MLSRWIAEAARIVTMVILWAVGSVILFFAAYLAVLWILA